MKVLVVEDTVELAALVQFALEREGWEVELAHSGAEALSKLTPYHHLMLVDLGLPDMSGEDVVAEVRGRADFATTKVVWFTAKAEASMPSGGVGVIHKPFEPQGLSEQLHRFLS